MQKDPLISALIGALFLGSLATLALGGAFAYQAHQSRTLQNQLIGIQNMRAMTESLAGDSIQYSKTHPAIVPILLRSGINAANLNTGK